MQGLLFGNILLALGAAGFWGVGDFSGGVGVKASGGSTRAALRFILMSHATSLAVLLVISAVRGDSFPHGRLLAWGLAAGVAAGLSLCAFYVALARGAMGASAAVSGVLAAAIPAVVSIGTDGAPGWRKGVGFLVAVIAIWMIAADESEQERASTMWLATAAGAGFGLYFVALKFAGAGGVIWPMANSRMGSLTTCGLLLLALGARAGEAKVNRRVGMWVLLTAAFDTVGNMMFVAATRAGRLDVAAVLASLYPASTILLAAVWIKERPTRRQGFGMAVAAVAVVLVAG